MTMTDQVADFLTRLRNADKAHHESLSLPYSKLKGTIAEILKSEGYIADFKVEVDRFQGKDAFARVNEHVGEDRDRGAAFNDAVNVSQRPQQRRSLDRDLHRLKNSAFAGRAARPSGVANSGGAAIKSQDPRDVAL